MNILTLSIDLEISKSGNKVVTAEYKYKDEVKDKYHESKHIGPLFGSIKDTVNDLQTYCDLDYKYRENVKLILKKNPFCDGCLYETDKSVCEKGVLTNIEEECELKEEVPF